MAGSSLGTIFQITTWGESHGAGVGVVIDGCPAGLSLCEADIQTYLNRRKPGQSKYSTPRRESDRAEILSGIFEGKTTGTPISILVRNENQKSKDYSEIASYYRPGHADFTFDQKYGFRDYRGGGRSSGRETIGRVAAGAVACKLLRELGISFLTYTKSIGPVTIDEARFDAGEISRNPLYMPDAAASEAAQEYLNECMDAKDSAGGIVECVISGMPTGIGEPVFDKLDAELARAMLSIGAVKGFEIGAGFKATVMKGSENNDAFITKNNFVKTTDRIYHDPAAENVSTDSCKPAMELFSHDENSATIEHECGNAKHSITTATNECGSSKHSITTATNHCGGVLGGMSVGTPIVFRAAIKPTPSIGQTQHTVKRDGTPIDINIGGRHDPVIVPRAVVVVEAMAALTVADLLMRNLSSKMENLQKIYLN